MEKEKGEKEMLCPMKFNTSSKGSTWFDAFAHDICRCEKDACAWWLKGKKMCAIADLVPPIVTIGQGGRNEYNK